MDRVPQFYRPALRRIPSDNDAFQTGVLVGVALLCAVLMIYELARRVL